MRKPTSFYPSPRVDRTAAGLVSHAGAIVLTATAGRAGLDRALSQALAPWRREGAVHDLGKVVLDLAIAVALGGDCLADIAVLRAEPGVFGRVASDPTFPGRSIGSPPMRIGPWRRSTPRHRRCGNGCGDWPVTGHRSTPRPLTRRS